MLEGGLGDNTINGGGDTDTVTYENSSVAVSVFLDFFGVSGAYDTETVGTRFNDTFTSIENIRGSAFADTSSAALAIIFSKAVRAPINYSATAAALPRAMRPRRKP